MDVLEGEDHVRTEQRSQQLGADQVAPLATELGCQSVDLGGHRHLHSEDLAEQREPRGEVRREVGNGSAEPCGECFGIDAVPRQDPPQEQPHGEVRRRSPRRFCPHVDPTKPGAALEELPQESALAAADVADDLDRPVRPASAHLLDDRVQILQFAVAPDEGRVIHDSRRRFGFLVHRPDQERPDRLRLALHEERLQLRRLELGPAALDDAGIGVHLSGSCRCHQPRRKVHRIADHGIRAPAGGADLAGEYVARVDPDLDVECALEFDDRTGGSEHPPLVVLACHWHSRRQDELAAVGVEVAGEKGDLLGVDDGLDRAEKVVQRCRGRLGTPLGQQRVRAGELDEADRCNAVLGLRRR